MLLSTGIRKKKVFLAQQAVWDIDSSGRESMPLACGYLKAFALADDDIRNEMDVRIYNFGGKDDALRVIQRMLLEEVPDILAISIFGWNYSMFGRVTETYRQLNPDGWVIFGGTHVAKQGQRVFRQYPEVDIVANGEGEITFREVLRAYLAGRSRHDLPDVPGISYKSPDGQVFTTPDAKQIVNLDEIPSPFLTGAMDLTFSNGQFKYDVVLMETNRGCPYKCAFCYWGGAIGQKLRKFSRERLAAEVELFARLEVVNICLCDSNFGMTKEDEEFTETLIRTRERTGFPRAVVTSWAKNKGKPFYRIISRMKQKGFHSSFTLALQTLSDDALERMNRKNMKMNEWEDLGDWLHKEGFDVYGEIIWGCPGETYASFLDGYDRLAAKVSRIAAYPLLLLPNTDYSAGRAEDKFITWRGGKDDFQYVLSHDTMTVAENRLMHRFLFWARICGEYMVFRNIWAPLRKLGGVTHSQVFLSLDRWFDAQTDAVAEGMRACRALVVDHFDAYAIERGLHYFFTEDMDALLQRWWEEEIVPLVPAELRDFFVELFRWDWTTKPLYRSAPGGELSVEQFDREDYFVRDVAVRYDFPVLLRAIAKGEPHSFLPVPHTLKLYFKKGFDAYISNHEFYGQYVGKTMEQLVSEQSAAYQGEVQTATPLPGHAVEEVDSPSAPLQIRTTHARTV